MESVFPPPTLLCLSFTAIAPSRKFSASSRIRTHGAALCVARRGAWPRRSTLSSLTKRRCSRRGEGRTQSAGADQGISQCSGVEAGLSMRPANRCCTHTRTDVMRKASRCGGVWGVQWRQLSRGQWSHASIHCVLRALQDRPHTPSPPRCGGAAWCLHVAHADTSKIIHFILWNCVLQRSPPRPRPSTLPGVCVWLQVGEYGVQRLLSH